MTIVPTETVSNQSSLKGFDLSPYTPPLHGDDPSSSLEQEENDKNEEDHPKEDMKHPVDEANLLDYHSDEGGDKDESQDGLLSKSQRLELYNQVAMDPESSDDEDHDVNDHHNYDEETSTTEEKETDSSTNDTSSIQEYKHLQEDEEEDDHEDNDALHDKKSDSYFDSTLAASLVSNHFEQFDMNAFHNNVIIHDEESDVMEQDVESFFKSSDIIVLEENLEPKKDHDDDHDPIQKFAKSIPLLKPPPAEKLEAYLKSQRK